MLKTLSGVGLALALALSQPAVAAPAPGWAVEAGSKLDFRGTMSGEVFNGEFRRWSAQIAFDPKNLAASKVVVSVDVASAATSDADRDSALPTADFFDAAKFPKAVFTSRVLRDLGGGKYEADGDLTLRGVTRPLALPFSLRITGDQAAVNGQLTLDRTAFGVGQNEWKATDVLKAQVAVIVSLTARRVH